LSSIAIGQNQGAKWHFGTKAGLDFMTTPPTAILNSSLITSEGCSGISDANGNLLFYTDGSTIWDALSNVMPNGTNLGGNSSTSQAAVVVKQPGNATIYFVFSLGVCGGGLWYSVVDMSQNGGLGSVMLATQPLAANCQERLTSVRHCNGIDTWVLAQQANTGNYLAYLVSAGGVNVVPVISMPGLQLNACVGYMKLSPNGKKLGVAFANNASLGFELYDFDASTGMVSNRLPLTTIQGNTGYGCEFSPDGTKFYGSLWFGTKIYQWDLCAGSDPAIVASQYTVACTAGSAIQLGINGKIYQSHPSQTYLGVINNPNAAGPGINYVDNGVSVFPKVCTFGLPNFITSGFKQPPPPFTHTVSMLYGCQTASFNAPPIIQNFSLVGCAASGYSLNNLSWNFGDPASGAANTSTLMNPSHAFSTLGTYTTSLILNYSCGGGTDTIKQVVIISQPCLTVNSTSITCANLGSATVTAAGGIGPYSYTWMPTAQTGPVANGLSPGTYTVTVQDLGNNFTYTESVTFTSLIPLTGNLNNTTSLTCNGATTGSASISNLSGGSGSQLYTWTNGSVTYTVPNPTNLPAGIWTYTITDALTGCTLNNAFIITQPTALSMTLSASSPSACAGNSVALSGTVSGGTPKVPNPAYGYTWTSGPVSASYAPVENISGNHVYTLTASDFYNCLISQTVALNVIPNPTLVVTNASICPLQTATLAVTGANSYSWNSLPGAYTRTYNPMVNTTYTVTGEIQGCFATATVAIILKTIPQPTLTSNSPLCSGAALTLTAGGGASYVFTGPAGFSSTLQTPTINPVGLNNAGVYNLTVTAANNCTASTSTNVFVNPTPTLNAIGNTACTSQVMNLNANSVAGATYSWSGPQNFSSGLQNVAIPLPALNQSGTYTVVATSVNGCTNTATATVSILQPPNLSISLSSTSLCAQALNGSPASIILTAGGATSYTLSTPAHISNPNPSGPVSPVGMLPPYALTGPATATLFGSNGVCSASTTVVFTVVPNPTVSINSATPVICAGESFTYTSSGADSYAWSSATPGQTLYTTGSVAVANPSINSIFSVMGGSLGCNSALQSSTITVNSLPSFSIHPSPARVCLGNSLPLTVHGTGTTFTWSPASGLTAATGYSVQANLLASQSYTVLGSLNNCTSTAVVTVSVLPLPVAAISIQNPSLCLNSTIVMTGGGGSSYAWSGPGSMNTYGPELNFKAISMAYSGIYTLTVTDPDGCQGKTTQSITVLGLPEGDFATGDMQGCAPFMAQLNFKPKPTSAPLQTINWQVNQQTFSGNSFSYYLASPGNYLVKGSAVDINTCANTFTAMIQAWPKPEANFSFAPDRPVERMEVEFHNTSKGASQFNWFFGSSNFTSGQQSPSFIFEDTGTYPVVLVAKNTWGCSDTTIKSIYVEPDFAVYVPNAFTPNGDGDNELFMAVTRGVTHFSLVIFNRWGQQLFESNTADAGWDGTFKGQPCKEDVYTWKIAVKGNNGTEKRLNGHVTLYR
jgi:gliding motility-associated-like protein